MDEREFLAQHFEEHRTRLRAVAYRMLGSLSEADDAVQETWLRLNRIDADEVENLAGWLTTVVARVSLNMLRSRRSRREEPLEVRMPEPIVDRADGTDPEHEALLADSVGLALLVVLETLNPAERLAFVLHDMFAVPFDEIAPIVDRSPEAARQLASRARRRVQGENTVPDADLAHPARGPRRLPRGRARGRLRGAARGAGPGRRPQGRPRRRLRSAPRRSSAERPTWPARRSPSRASTSRCGRRSSTARSARSPSATGGRSRSRASRSGTGRIVEMDILADPERLSRLDLMILD